MKTNRVVPALVFLCIASLPASLRADLVSVKYAEGLSHGFLILKQPDGTQIAEGGNPHRQCVVIE